MNHIQSVLFVKQNVLLFDGHCKSHFMKATWPKNSKSLVLLVTRRKTFPCQQICFLHPFHKKKVFELPLQRKKPKNPTIIWSMKLFGLSNYCQISLLIWVIKYCRRISNLQSSSTWYRQKQSPIQPTFKKKLMVLCQVAFKMRNIGIISEPTVIRSIWQWWYSVSHA